MVFNSIKAIKTAMGARYRVLPAELGQNYGVPQGWKTQFLAFVLEEKNADLGGEEIVLCIGVVILGLHIDEDCIAVWWRRYFLFSCNWVDGAEYISLFYLFMTRTWQR